MLELYLCAASTENQHMLLFYLFAASIADQRMLDLSSVAPPLMTGTC